MRRTFLLTALLLACGGDDASTPADGGADATQLEGGGADSQRPLVCGNSPWLTYGFDAHRASASDGCIEGPLTVGWRYAPTAVPFGDGGVRQVLAVDHAVAQGDGVFLTWGIENFINGAPGGITQSVDRIDPSSGKATWSFVPVFGDGSYGKWATVGLGSVLYDSDGLYWVDAKTGVSAHGYGVDYWGDVLTDDTQAYANNTSFVDGPPLFVAAYDTAGKQVWQKNVFGTTKHVDRDDVGAMALDGGTLFLAAKYAFGTSPPAFASGVYALDPATGNQRWLQPTNPSSDIAAVDGTLFLSEGTSVVARKESDGSVIWTQPYSTPTPGAAGAAPVVTQSLVIVQEASGITARSKQDGSLAWSAPLTPTKDVGIATLHCDAVLAAALGSDTLVAVDATTVHVLALSDGHEIWSGVPPGLVGVRLTSPVVVGKRLYVTDRGPLGTAKGALLAMDSP